MAVDSALSLALLLPVLLVSLLRPSEGLVRKCCPRNHLLSSEELSCVSRLDFNLRLASNLSLLPDSVFDEASSRRASAETLKRSFEVKEGYMGKIFTLKWFLLPRPDSTNVAPLLLGTNPMNSSLACICKLVNTRGLLGSTYSPQAFAANFICEIPCKGTRWVLSLLSTN